MAFIGVLALGCREVPNQNPATEATPQKGEISLSNPEALRFRDSCMAGLIDSLKTGYYPNRHSLLIFKDSQLVVEEYFSGRDENWGTDLGIVTYNDTLLHDMRSVSKSVVSACMGLALSQGLIKSVDQPVFDFFDDYQQYRNQGREALTLEHLLTMTSGLQWNEEVPYDNPENSEIQMINSGDAIGFVLSRPLIAQPGAKWQYNGGTTELLAEIIRRVSGKDIHDFAKEFLFAPLGITRSEWTVSPATHTPAAASGLRLSARDLLKFGLLYHRNGLWGMRQIVPKEWVRESLTAHIARPDGGGYGYQFWIFNISVQGESRAIPAAVGNGDQRIFFDKPNNMVVVTTAGNYNKWDIANNASAVLERIYGCFNTATQGQ